MGLILKQNLCFDVNGRFDTTWKVTLYMLLSDAKIRLGQMPEYDWKEEKQDGIRDHLASETDEEKGASQASKHFHKRI